MIETKRLILRPFVVEDAGDVYEYLHEPAVHCFADQKLDSPEAAGEEMKRRQGDDLYLAIVLNKTFPICRTIG